MPLVTIGHRSLCLWPGGHFVHRFSWRDSLHLALIAQELHDSVPNTWWKNRSATVGQGVWGPCCKRWWGCHQVPAKQRAEPVQCEGTSVAGSIWCNLGISGICADHVAESWVSELLCSCWSSVDMQWHLKIAKLPWLETAAESWRRNPPGIKHQSQLVQLIVTVAPPFKRRSDRFFFFSFSEPSDLGLRHPGGPIIHARS